MDHMQRIVPSSIGQRIVVMVGPQRGMEGVTIAKVGLPADWGQVDMQA